MLVGLSAVAISLGALAVGAYEAYLQRVYDRASVWPRVELTAEFGPRAVKLELVNSGLGPAIIESANVTFAARPAADWPDVLRRLLGRMPPAYSTGSMRDRAIRAGDSAMILAVPAAALAGIPAARRDSIGLVVCYASVFHERWELVVDGMGTRSKPTRWRSVDDCPRQTSDAF